MYVIVLGVYSVAVGNDPWGMISVYYVIVLGVYNVAVEG